MLLPSCIKCVGAVSGYVEDIIDMISLDGEEDILLRNGNQAHHIYASPSSNRNILNPLIEP